MVSEKFRHQLRKEAKRWQTDGLINEQTYKQIALRYEFENLDTAASNRFVAILLGLGAIFLGLAAITFVAANWQALSKELKVLLLISIFAIANISGFYLWKNPLQGWRSRLGQALLLLGGLTIGANLGLMSQIFHQSGPVYQLFLVWGLAVVLMAFSLRLTSLGILGIILTIIGYLSGISSLYSSDYFSIFKLAISHLPILVSLIFIPLAYWCKSRWIFTLSSLLVIFALPINLLPLGYKFYSISPLFSGLIYAGITIIPGSLLWAYRDSFWFRSWQGVSNFEKIACNLAIFSLSLAFYLFSFNIFWRESFPVDTSASKIVWQEWSMLFELFFFFFLMVLSWWRLGYSFAARSPWKIDLNSTLVGVSLAITALIIFYQININPLGAIATLIFNIFLFVLGILAIGNSLKTGTRLGFWWGITILTIQILSRMLEYNTGLMLKAIVLFGCGVTIIYAGIKFEEYLKKQLVKDSSQVL